MSDAIENYIDLVGYRDHPVLAACRTEAQSRGEMAVMQVAPEQAAFLQFLIGLLRPTRVLEIGTFTGYSAMAMALALPHDGRVTTVDNDADIVDLARAFWEEAGVGDRIEPMIGDATAALNTLRDERGSGWFDFILIDADKPAYPRYYESALDLLRPGGVMVVDDTLIHGRVVTGALPGDPHFVAPAAHAVRELNAAIHADPRIDMVMIPWRDGMTLVRKRAE